jgi:hypothetical protein
VYPSILKVSKIDLKNWIRKLRLNSRTKKILNKEKRERMQERENKVNRVILKYLKKLTKKSDHPIPY